MRKNHSIIWLKEAIEMKEKSIFKLHHFDIITIKMSFCHFSLRPEWEFVCISFRTDNHNCFRVS